ncbi:MAG: hypothetical protein ACSHXY_06165 [Alphaproteobacteria bacterium]
MRVISTVFCLFAAFIMMATPVMACCVTGHVDTPMNSAQAADASAPPCHTTAEAKSGDSDTQTPEKYCSSCDDCTVSSAFTAYTDPVTNTQSDLTFVTLINNPTALPRPEVRLLRTTGPPPRQPLGPFDSPFSRFDTQLI